MKKCLMLLLGVISLLGLMTSCEDSKSQFGTGDGTEDVGIVLTRCWKLKAFCNTPAEVDIYIDFEKNGTFAIYQCTEELGYTVFEGTYTADEESSELTGEYSDGTPWASSYIYTLSEKAKEMKLESVERPAEVSIYEPAKVPTSATLSTRSASTDDVKPL